VSRTNGEKESSAPQAGATKVGHPVPQARDRTALVLRLGCGGGRLVNARCDSQNRIMKATRTKDILLLMLVLFGIALGREAQAFYNPSTGRWLSRDPIGRKRSSSSMLDFTRQRNGLMSRMLLSIRTWS
jgi:hypothetical protein